jgi:predicted lipase
MKSIGFFFSGLGCNLDPEQILYYTFLKTIDNMKIIMECPKSTMGVAVDVFKIQYDASVTREFEKYIYKKYNKIQRYLDQGYTVYLAGHSMGGCIVTILADLFHETKHVHKIKCMTAGSIYIKPLQNLEIQHYINKNDFVLQMFHETLPKKHYIKSNGDGHFAYHDQITKFFN